MRKPVSREQIQQAAPLLSILTCTLPNRLDQLLTLVSELRRQSIGKEVEFIYLGDNKSMTVGEKRNILLNMACGDYVIFVDDDDTVSPDFVKEILDGCRVGSDCVVYLQDYQVEGGEHQTIYFAIENGKNHRADGLMKWLPNHTCAIRRTIAQGQKFENINLSEDHKWAEAIRPSLKTEYRINKVLYYYRYDPHKSETHPR